MSVTKRFSEQLIDIKWPTLYKCINEGWNVSGIIKNRSNEHLKFDTRPMQPVIDDRVKKNIDLKSLADKVVFESVNKWILIDTKEFYEYMSKNNKKEVNIEELEKELEWNIIIIK
jgi:hypothetical protein